MILGMLLTKGRGGSFLNQGLTTFNFSSITIGSTDTNAVRIATDGDIDEFTSSAYVDRGDWLLAGGVASQHEVRFVFESGTQDGGVTAGDFHALSSSREVSISTEGVETDTAEVTVTIRKIVNPADAITFTVNLSATEETL